MKSRNYLCQVITVLGILAVFVLGLGAPAAQADLVSILTVVSASSLQSTQMYWTDLGTNKIQRANLDGSNVEDLVTTGLSSPEDIGLDLSTGKMYWTEYSYNKIQRANLDGSNVEDLVTTGLSGPWGIALDVSAGKMYWVDASTDRIRRANLDGSNVEDLISTGLGDPYDIAVDPSGGKMYWADYSYDKIQRANLDGSNIEDLVTTGLSGPLGIAVDPSGGKVYWTEYTYDKIQRANLDGSNVEDLVTTGLSNPRHIALELSAGKMYWTDISNNKIQRANLDGSNVEDLVTTGLSDPAGIAIPQTVTFDDLRIQPYGGLVSSGRQGGPFTPSDRTYTLTNEGPNSLDWTASATQGWVDVVPVGGTLGSGASTTVIVSLNVTTSSLPVGVYTDTVTFSNLTSGIDRERWVELTVTLEQAKLVASDGYNGDNFGHSVCVSGDYAIVGAPYEDVYYSNSGAAYIFRRDGVDWVEEAKLTASDGYSSDYFGFSVSIDGDYAIVGAYQDDDGGSNSGSAYIFKRTGTNWSQEAKLLASDGYSSDYFGYSVSIDGGYCIVGAYLDDDRGSSSGSAYIFSRTGTNWSQEAKLLASDGYNSDYFGYSVSIDGAYAVIGAYGDDDRGGSSGSAYIFADGGGTWSQQAKLTASDGYSSDYFGRSVCINGAQVIIGAYGDDDKGSYSGSAYIFSRSGTVWSQEAKLRASDGSSSDYFGWSVSITGNYTMVGAYRDDEDYGDCGSAYLFDYDGASWSEQAKLTASDGYSGDYYGYSVSVDGETGIAGAPRNDSNGNDAGAAYIYSFAAPDDLVVSAAESPEDFWSSGDEEGPFDPVSKEYIVSNTGANSVDWTAETTCTWVHVAPTSGTLAGNSNTVATVWLDSSVSDFEPGMYTCSILFTNVTSGVVRARRASLDVQHVPGEIEVINSITHDANDPNMPFGELVVGLSRVEQITISNVDSNPRHELIVEDISLSYGDSCDVEPCTDCSAGYVEDFNDGNGPEGWEEHYNGAWNIVYPYGDGDGEYHPAATSSYRTMQSIYTGQEWRDVAMEVTLRRTYTGYEAGVIIRASEDFSWPNGYGSAYVICERGDGYYWIRKYVNGYSTYLQGSTYSPYLNTGSVGNVIKVRMQGPELEVFFNSHLAWSGTDSSIPDPGRVGLFAYQRRTYYHYYFDDVRVHSLGFSLEGLPELPVTIEPGADLTFDVNFTPSAFGDYEATVLIRSEDRDDPNMEVFLTGTGIPEYLDIVPVNDVEFYGHPGGPFVPTYVEYILTNNGPVSLDWIADVNVDWLDVTPSGGSIDPCDTATVAVTPNTKADKLAEGYYEVDVNFTDLMTTLTQKRGVGLNAYIEPKIWANPYLYEISVPQGATKSQVLVIGNTGGADLTYTLQPYIYGVPWLDLEPDSGTISPGDTNEVSVTINAGCYAGTYEGSITVYSNDPYVPEIIIPVTIVVKPLDYFTELFVSNDNDMANRTLTFIPDGSDNYYSLCIKESRGFGVDPAGGTVVSLEDDDYAAVNLSGVSVNFYGASYDTLYIGSNGYITFTTGDIAHFETSEAHFNFPRISAVFDDLDPSAGGEISYKQLEDRVVVTYEDVPEYSTGNAKSFQLELCFSGKIKVTLLDIPQDGLIGLSEGGGVPGCMLQSDLSQYDWCALVGDFDGDVDVDLYDFSILAGAWRDKYRLMETVRDEFSTSGYSGNDGSENWAGDWQELGESDGPDRGFIKVTTDGQLQIGVRNRKFATVRTLTREVDISGVSTATLSYDYVCEDNSGVGYVSVSVSADGGLNWETVAVHHYNAGSGFANFDITDYISSQMQVAFQTSSEIGMYLYVDNVQVEYGDPALPWFAWSGGCDLNQDWQIDLEDLRMFCEHYLE